MKALASVATSLSGLVRVESRPPLHAVTSALLDPPRIRAAIRRRWFARRMKSVAIVPDARLTTLGSEEYGGWMVPAQLIDESWTCWCVGAGADVSFDMELLSLGARVRSFDPFELFKQPSEEQANGSERYSFHVYAVAPEDGPVTMYGRQDVHAGSVSGVNLYGVDTAFEKPGRSIPSLMQELGDERIDLLKLDVEGMEYDILASLDVGAFGVSVLCVEFHATDRGLAKARTTIGRLRSQGFVAVHVDGTDFTFLAARLLSASSAPAAR